MEFTVYQRPREKLRTRGVSSLSVVELIQIVIGSGSVKASGPKIARHIEKLLIDSHLTYDTLMAIHGVGEAKACQILAMVELSTRLVKDE